MSTHTYTINDRPVTEEEYCSSKEDGVHRAYYDTGVLKYEYPYVNGQVHGVRKAYYDTGALMYEVPYVNGQKHGVRKNYRSDGSLEWETPYVNGKPREDLKDNKLAKLVLFGSEECLIG